MSGRLHKVLPLCSVVSPAVTLTEAGLVSVVAVSAAGCSFVKTIFAFLITNQEDQALH